MSYSWCLRDKYSTAAMEKNYKLLKTPSLSPFLTQTLLGHYAYSRRAINLILIGTALTEHNASFVYYIYYKIFVLAEKTFIINDCFSHHLIYYHSSEMSND